MWIFSFKLKYRTVKKVVDTKKIHFANFFNVFPDTSLMQNSELAFDADYRLVFKDEDGVIHPIVSVSDYANIYSPLGITVTQTVKSAKVGVGTEGDFSAKVTKSMPLTNVLTATGMHKRLMLVQYDNNNNMKDAIILPEYFCKMGTYADSLDINQGVITEYIKKIEIKEHQGVTTLTNNKIFKIFKTETTDVSTTLNLPLTTEANKDVIANRNQMYIGADGWLYIIKDKAVADLTYSFWFFNRRSTSVKIRINTTIPLIEKNDKFVFETYRSISNNIIGSSYQFVDAGDSAQITKVLVAEKTTSLGKVQMGLGISTDKKSVTGIDESGAYYRIIVITDEVPIIPTLVYQFLDVQEGFFGYLYTILKNINDNEQQTPIDLESLSEIVRLSLLTYLEDLLIPKADLDSPTFVGIPKGPTAAVGTNTKQLATTEFVISQAGTTAPVMDGVATVGVSTKYAREDHKHPIDTSRAAVDSPTFTGTPQGPTAAVGTNTDQLATTKFVISQAGTAAPVMDGTATVGTSTKYAREDHKHPIDTSRAPVNAPTFTGTVKTQDIDMQRGKLWDVSNIPVVNLMPDSGRFMGTQQNPYAMQSTNVFENNTFFNSYNGSNIAPGGKFIYNNTDNGGTSGNMTPDVVALLNAMNSLAGKDKRYGAEFYVADITQGSGTSDGHPSAPTHYLLTINNFKNMTGSGGYFTFSFWMRLKSGSGVTVARNTRLFKNGVDITASTLTLSTSDDWVHIQSVFYSNAGYNNSAPNIYAPTGAVVQIALPVVTSGGTGVGIHTSPIPRLDLGYTAASTNNPTFTGNVTLPATTTIGTVTAAEIAYLSGLTGGIQGQLNAKAPLASPTFTGVPQAPTAAVNTNTDQIATTKFVLNQAGTANPLMNGAVAVGTSTKYAREDHVHPVDTSRAPLASPTFTGTVVLPATTSIGTITSTELGYLSGLTGGIQGQLNAKAPLASPTFTGTPQAPTASIDTNTDQIATTKFVLAQAGTLTPVMDGTANVGGSVKYARQDHVHPSDTSRAPLASPTFTGTVVLPSTTSIGTVTAAEIGYLSGLTSGIQSQLNNKAPLANPVFSGVPQVPTATLGTSNGQIASTQFVQLNKYHNIVAKTSGTLVAYTVDIPGVTSLFDGLTFSIMLHVASGENPTLNVNGLGAKILSSVAGMDPSITGANYVFDVTYIAVFNAFVLTGGFSKADLYSPVFKGTPTAPTKTTGDRTAALATTQFVGNAIDAMASGAPTTLNTLTKLAAAINNDPAFFQTINTALAGKASSVNPTFSGTLLSNAIEIKSTLSSKKYTFSYNTTDDSLDIIYTP